MTPKEIASLQGTALRNAFVEYFKAWAITPQCLELLNELANKVVDVTYDDELKVHFEDYDKDVVTITFGTAYEGDFQETPFQVPESYKTVVRMHNTIKFGDGIPEYVELYGYDGEAPYSEFMMEELEGDEERHQGFCDAGQNWVIWDHQRKNALGEPVMIIADHGMTVADSEDFPEQDTIAFGVGGLFIRMMKEFIYDDTDYGWG